MRKLARISQAELGRRLNSGRSTIVKLESGEMGLTTKWMHRIARELLCDPADLLPGGESMEVPVVGYVGGGAQIHPFDDSPLDEGTDAVRCPRGLDPDKTVAAVVRGDSMFPIDDGWVVFWTRSYRGVPIDAVGCLCVVQVADDGPLLIKRLRPGYEQGLFNLLSSNAAPLDNILLEWAAKVEAIIAPGLGQYGRVAAVAGQGQTETDDALEAAKMMGFIELEKAKVREGRRAKTSRRREARSDRDKSGKVQKLPRP